jgi:hypothetical protein
MLMLRDGLQLPELAIVFFKYAVSLAFRGSAADSCAVCLCLWRVRCAGQSRTLRYFELQYQ